MSLRPDDLPARLSDSRWVEQLAYSLVGDRALAEDLSQEALTAAWQGGPSQPEKLKPWLSSTVRRLSLRWRRDAARRRHVDRREARERTVPSTQKLVAESELRRKVAEEAERLAEPYRTAIFLRYFEGLSAAEIARKTNTPAGTVRARISRGLDLVRERMDARPDGNRGAWAGLALGFGPGLAAPPYGGQEHALPHIETPIIEGVLTMKGIHYLSAAALLGALALGAWKLSSPPELPEQPAINELASQPLQGGPDDGEQELMGSSDDELSRSEVAAAAAQETEALHVAAAAPRTGVVRLTVVDADGRGLPGARVRSRVSPYETLSDPDWTGPNAAAGAGGHVLLTVPLEESNRHDFEVSYGGLASRFVRAQVSSERETHLGRIEMGTAGRLTGRVEDALGKPMSDVLVFVTAPEGLWDETERTRRLGPEIDEPFPVVLSDQRGEFVFEGLAAGFVRVWAYAEGFGYAYTDPWEVVAEETRRDVVVVLEELRATDTVTGMVLQPDGSPATESTVLYNWTFEDSSTSTSTKVDARGHFSILLNRRVPLNLCAYDRQGRWSSIVLPQVQPGALGLVLQYEEARHVTLVVTDDEERPVTRFTAEGICDPVQIEGMHIGALTRVREEIHAEGRAQLVVPTRTFKVQIDAPGFAVETAGPFDPQTVGERIEITLTPLPGVHGQVLAAGKPVVGARVVLRRLTGPRELFLYNGFRFRLQDTDHGGVETDGEGRFRLDLRRSGTYALRVVNAGHAIAEAGPFELDPRTGKQGIIVELGHGGAIEGRVLVAQDESPAGVNVAINDGATPPQYTRVGEDGRYRFDGLTPGQWQVVVVAEEVGGRTRSSSHASLPEDAPPIDWNCEVFEGATTKYDVDLRERTDAFVSGRLRLSNHSTQGWTASFAETKAESTASSTALGADGSFRLGSVPEGSVELILRSPDQGSGSLVLREWLELEDGENLWDLELEVGAIDGHGAPTSATSEVSLEYSMTRPVSGREVTATAAVRTDQSGTFALGVVPAGAGQIRRWTPTGTGPRLGEWTTLTTFEVERGGVIRVDL